MRTFSIQTLGCKVNQYEGEQLAGLLRSHGLVRVDDPAGADLRVVNTCSVTVQAASKSRQLARRNVNAAPRGNPGGNPGRVSLPVLPPSGDAASDRAHPTGASGLSTPGRGSSRSRVLITGCWATSDRREAQRLLDQSDNQGAVLTHHDDVAAQLSRILASWQSADSDIEARIEPGTPNAFPSRNVLEPTPSESLRNDGWMNQAGIPAGQLTTDIKASKPKVVNNNSGGAVLRDCLTPGVKTGTASLPLLDRGVGGHQRAFLKVQDGCDAHCTYCIIPSLRPALWSKPIDDAVEEATRLVAAGHVELVLTGIFLGAYGQATALRRRQGAAGAGRGLAELVEALCTRVPGLRRLRLSSLEPGDLTAELIEVLRSHEQVVPHFHLPLQSGSDVILRRMNRQYTRDDYLRMLDRVNDAFDRPAVTTDVIVAFPGETEGEFERTIDVVGRARFIHVHAFPFSPRPGTAAARWKKDYVRGPVANERIGRLEAMAAGHCYEFRRQFLGEVVEVLVEKPSPQAPAGLRHGRCPRYFAVHFEDAAAVTGQSVRVRITRVAPDRTFGEVVR